MLSGDLSGCRETPTGQLEQQGRVHEVPDRGQRLAAIARAYAEDPDRTLVVSPDHHSQLTVIRPTGDRSPTIRVACRGDPL